MVYHVNYASTPLLTSSCFNAAWIRRRRDALTFTSHCKEQSKKKNTRSRCGYNRQWNPNRDVAATAIGSWLQIQLPSIHDHILSLLEIKNLERLNLASRRCQELCRSCLRLSLCNKNLKNGPSHRLCFNYFLDRSCFTAIWLGWRREALASFDRCKEPSKKKNIGLRHGCNDR